MKETLLNHQNVGFSWHQTIISSVHDFPYKEKKEQVIADIASTRIIQPSGKASTLAISLHD